MTPWTVARQTSLSFTISWIEFAQTHVHWVSDAIQPSHPLSSPLLLLSIFRQMLYHLSHQGSPPSFPASQFFLMSQVFGSGGQSIEASTSASVLPVNIEDWFTLGLTGLISLLSKRLLSIFSSTIQTCQFLNTQPSLWPTSHIHTWLLKKPYFGLYGPLLAE